VPPHSGEQLEQARTKQILNTLLSFFIGKSDLSVWRIAGIQESEIARRVFGMDFYLSNP
jgi:hypothetical protein